MLEVLKMVSPSPEEFAIIFQGMRNAFKSYDRSDSFFCKKSFVSHENGTLETYVKGEFILGANDKNLAINLVKAGNPSHRKFLRQLSIIIRIKAPLYWWKQFDAYGVGITKNSESTMHTLVKKPFELSDFSIDMDLAKTVEISNVDRDFPYHPPMHPVFDIPGWFDMYNSGKKCPPPVEYIFTKYINNLNALRDEYLNTSDNKYWELINQMLPQSYNQIRTVSLNYEVALQIIEQRSGHRLSEWRTLIDALLELPYMREFAEAARLLEVD